MATTVEKCDAHHSERSTPCSDLEECARLRILIVVDVRACVLYSSGITNADCLALVLGALWVNSSTPFLASLCLISHLKEEHGARSMSENQAIAQACLLIWSLWKDGCEREGEGLVLREIYSRQSLSQMDIFLLGLEDLESIRLVPNPGRPQP